MRLNHQNTPYVYPAGAALYRFLKPCRYLTYTFCVFYKYTVFFPLTRCSGPVAGVASVAGVAGVAGALGVGVAAAPSSSKSML